MTKEDVEAALVLFVSAVTAFDKSSQGVCAETAAMTKQAKETLKLETWRPPAPVLHLATSSTLERKEG